MPNATEVANAVDRIKSERVPSVVAEERALKAADASTVYRGVGDAVVVNADLLAASVDKTIFTADRAYRVVAIKEAHSVIGGAGAVVRPRKVSATAAPGDAAGANVKELTTANIGLETTINTVVTPTLSATPADLVFAAGDRLCLDFAGTLTGLVGEISVSLIPV